MINVILEVVVKHWITWLMTILTGCVAALWRKVSQDRKERIQKDKANEKALQALMRINIYQAYRECIDKGEITASELKVLEELNSAYHAIGGNGIVTEMMQRLYKLRIVVDDL